MPDYSKIVPLAQNGDPKALDELYSATFRAVYFTCLSFVKNEQDAEDIAQNTYMAAFKKLNTLAKHEKFEPWIKRIAVNLCKDFLTKKGAHPEQQLDDTESAAELTDEGILPEEYIMNGEKRGIVLKIMRETLSDTLYRTVIMFYFDEMSIAEIAEEMNCPEGTVKYRLNAARAKIRKGVLDYEKRTDDKLYAFVGLPFLTRLLIEEAKNINVPALGVPVVPANNSSFIPDNAVGGASDTAVNTAANLTADTAAKGGLKLFLSTLKGKIIAAAAAAAVVGGGTTAAVVAANSAEGSYNSPSDFSANSSSSPNASEEQPFTASDGSPSVKPDDTAKPPQSGSASFWFTRQTWNEAPRKDFEGGFLIDGRKTINPEELDDICAPYYNPLMNTAGNIAPTFAAALMAEEDILAGSCEAITTQYIGDGETLPEFSGAETIEIHNFDNISHSMYDCYENGWWKIAAGENFGSLPETTALGLDASLRDERTTPHEDALLDAIVEKFGTPHYVRYVGSSSADKTADRRQMLIDSLTKASEADGEPMAANYDLVYDYGDMVMTVCVWEQRFISGSLSTGVDYVEFWSAECWENRSRVDLTDPEINDLFTVYRS